MLDQDITKSLTETSQLLDQLRANLKFAVNPVFRSHLPFELLCLREILLYRVIDLSEAAVKLLSEEMMIPGFILVRSVMESVAVLLWAKYRMIKVVEEKQIGKIEQFLLQALIGDKSKVVKPLHVLDAIRSANKIFSSYHIMYDALSEYTHPNWSGTQLAYSGYDKEELCLNLGLNPRGHSLIMGVSPLWISLTLFKEAYDYIFDNLDPFINVCETSLIEPGK